MNVMQELRKQRRAVLRRQGQPIYEQPGKRARRVIEKAKHRKAITLDDIERAAQREAKPLNWAQRFYQALTAKPEPEQQKEAA